MKKCFNCNKEYDAGIDFCPSCGSALKDEMPQADAAASAAPVYTQPAPQAAPVQQAIPVVPVRPVNNEPVSIGEWMVMLVQFIPCVGWLVWLIILLVWAFGDNVKESKKTFAKANLIVTLVIVALFILFYVMILGAGLSFASLVEDMMYDLY